MDSPFFGGHLSFAAGEGGEIGAPASQDGLRRDSGRSANYHRTRVRCTANAKK
jgi:hypothetical protein